MQEVERRLRERDHDLDLEKLPGLRPIDDDFMRCLFKENIPLAQFVLRIIMEKPDLIVTELDTQADMKRLGGARSVTLDVYATDDSNQKYDIEVQREGKGARPRRARYHASVMAIENLNQGQEFEELIDTYTIFITEKDFYGDGEPCYKIERVNTTRRELFGDGDHILYVNGEYRGDSDVGKLMHDFCCSDPDDMYFDIIADRTRYLKGMTKGDDTVCKAFEESRLDSAITASIISYKDCGLQDDQIIEKLLSRFDITKEVAKKYINEMNTLMAV